MRTPVTTLFKGLQGSDSAAQIEAFDDTWHWNDNVKTALHEVNWQKALDFQQWRACGAHILHRRAVPPSASISGKGHKQ